MNVSKNASKNSRSRLARIERMGRFTRSSPYWRNESKWQGTYVQPARLPLDVPQVLDKSQKLCPYFDTRARTAVVRNHEWSNCVPRWEKGEVPERKIECPVCHRRVRQRISFCDDGCCALYFMPQHKRRGWQKPKNRKNSRESRLTKRRVSGML